MTDAVGHDGDQLVLPLLSCDPLGRFTEACSERVTVRRLCEDEDTDPEQFPRMGGLPSEAGDERAIPEREGRRRVDLRTPQELSRYRSESIAWQGRAACATEACSPGAASPHGASWPGASAKRRAPADQSLWTYCPSAAQSASRFCVAP